MSLREMSFREKSAWITLVTVAACFGVYFGGILTGAVSPRGFDTLHLGLFCVAALIVLQVTLSLIAARISQTDAPVLADEREKLIQSRSHTIGYYTLIVLVLALVLPGHIGHGVVDLMNFALFDVVLVTLIVAVAQIVMFRRGF